MDWYVFATVAISFVMIVILAWCFIALGKGDIRSSTWSEVGLGATFAVGIAVIVAWNILYMRLSKRYDKLKNECDIPHSVPVIPRRPSRFLQSFKKKEPELGMQEIEELMKED